MKRYFVSLALTAIAALAAEPSEEALFIRRIAEFQKDRETQLLKSQIREFLGQYPNSLSRDSLLLILADTYFAEEQYKNALQAYLAISSESQKAKWQEPYLRCLYKLKNYEALSSAVLSLPLEQTEAIHFFYYKEATGGRETKQSKIDYLSMLEKMIEKFPQFEMRDALFFDRAKILYELEEYDLAQKRFLEYAVEHEKDPNLYLVHLLIAQCAKKKSLPRLFVRHALKSLKIKPDQADAMALRLGLFNEYLQLAKESRGKRASLSYKRAANHLYKVILENDELVKLENKLWLANFYYQEALVPKDDYLIEQASNRLERINGSKSALVFEKALKKDKALFSISHSDDLYLEAEVYKLSTLYAWLGKFKSQKDLLESLSAYQNANAAWPWKLRLRTKFGLAHAYEKIGHDDLALEAFKELSSQKGIDPYISNASKLYHARLAFKALGENDRHMDNTVVAAVLKDLKDLQIRKNPASEPSHLEAAIDYASIRSSLESGEKALEQNIFLLRRAKENFLCQDDICSKEYHSRKDKDEVKRRLYLAYMLLIDAHLARLEAKSADLKGDKEAFEEWRSKSLALYVELLKKEFAVSKYVVDQAELGLKTFE